MKFIMSLFVCLFAWNANVFGAERVPVKSVDLIGEAEEKQESIVFNAKPMTQLCAGFNQDSFPVRDLQSLSKALDDYELMKVRTTVGNQNAFHMFAGIFCRSFGLIRP